MRITVAGAGYVGLSNGLMLSKKNDVIIFDNDETKVKNINLGISPLEEEDIKNMINYLPANIIVTSDSCFSYKNSDYLIIATPTDYDEINNYFNTTSVNEVVSEALTINPEIKIIIKSTLPVGHTELLRKEFKNDNIFFMPEFLREGSALHDSLFPSRIIIGGRCSFEDELFSLFLDVVEKKDVECIATNPSEAEAVKLFSNTYLALRVSFFNELDSYSAFHKLESSEIIKGVCLDDRIGDYYNNPSFGYGGYCLPKDTKQLLANYKNVPQTLMQAVVDSNELRINFIVQEILSKKAKKIGIYKLAMKSESDNFRFSSTIEIVKKLKQKNIQLVIYEPTISSNFYEGIPIQNDFSSFSSECDLIIANRLSKELSEVSHKVFSRDLFEID